MAETANLDLDDDFDFSELDDLDNLDDDKAEETSLNSLGLDENSSEDLSDDTIDESDFNDIDEKDLDEKSFDNIDDLSTDIDKSAEETEETEVDTSAYSDGTPVSNAELMETDDDQDENDLSIEEDADFISSSGDFVVMDNTQNLENAFELKTIDINDIAITKRVRQNASADDITRSIKSTGLLMPPIVAPTATDGLYVLLDGWRRLMGCARAGKRMVPVLVNNNVNTPEIPILEAMYNHARKYTIKEIVDYIDYLEKEKGIMNPSMIEYLLQLNSGDYTKLKDILNDNDDDIVEKLYNGAYDIDTAFRKLEQRRKKESLEEKENKKAAAVYDDEEASGADQIQGSGEEADGPALSEEQINDIMLNASDLDDGLEEASLDDMVKEGAEMPAFKPHKQKTGEREYIDPLIKKTVMARDNSTCQCCLKGGESYVDALDFHHILPVFLGGNDSPENGIMLCLTCHRLVHLYSTGDMHVPPEKSKEEVDAMSEEDKVLYNDEQMRFKRIVKLGGVIRKGIAAKGMNREEYKRTHSNDGIGRNKPGQGQEKA